MWESRGLSPRGRGNPIVRMPGMARYIIVGSIPAWAGEPSDLDDRGQRQPVASLVYPRVGGGTWISMPAFVAVDDDGPVYPRVGGGTCEDTLMRALFPP